MPWRCLGAGSVLLLLTFSPLCTRGAILETFDATTGDFFGSAAGLSDNLGLIGASTGNSNRGSVYVFRNLDTVAGSVTQNAELTASDGATSDDFGVSVSLSGAIGLVGADQDADQGSLSGSAYVFRGLDTVSGSVTQNVKLTASDGAAFHSFGKSVSLAGHIGLVGAFGDGIHPIRGEAYVFRNLDTASGGITENLKLSASDDLGADLFGHSVSLSGSLGLVGGPGADSVKGAAYVFRNLDTISGSITENAKLTASDGAANDGLGFTVSLSGNIGLAGAQGDDSNKGSAYVFRNLDTASGSITENAKLTASDGAANDAFGTSLSLSGSTAVVVAYAHDSFKGAAYVFRHLDTASGSITENVELTASSNVSGERVNFLSVSVDGDRFVIGALGAPGKAYSGSLSCFTTLDTGQASRETDGLSFVSQDDWIVGQDTSANLITLSAGDTGVVVQMSKGVFIGQNAGSNNNRLDVPGTLDAYIVHIGSVAGNSGNTLQFHNTTVFSLSAIQLAPDNFLKFEGDYTHIADLLTRLGAAPLQLWNGSAWVSVTADNAASLITSSLAAGITTIRAVPAPSPVVAFSVSISGPKKIVTTKSRLTIKGKASVRNGSLTRVEVKVGKAGYKPAGGGASWKFQATLKPGKNAILVRAVDASGATSSPTKITIIRK